MQLARPLAVGQCFFTMLSFGCLLYAFYSDDFSVHIVAEHSNSTLPVLYKIAATWAGHEGSLLLWALILSVWIGLASICSRSLPLKFVTSVLSILALIFTAFLLFLLATSNPFARLLLNTPLDGLDLNPLLQDPGLMIHPPILYTGYAGLAIPFAFAAAVLITGQLESSWIRWLRPWVLVAFACLTIGITLGSWWAYYELGWGGWWFWDPVENASFMPWLIGIALIHSLFVSEKSRLWIGWTLFLALIIFILVLIGLCLVRSGILASVHAFASDPTRGVFMFSFLTIILVSTSMLYVFRLKQVMHAFHANDMNRGQLFFSREVLTWISTVFLVVATFTILFGTLFPLLYEFLVGQKISVGFPYFNAVFIPMMVPFLGLIPLGPLSRWGTGDCNTVLGPCIKTFFLSLIFSLVVVFIFVPLGIHLSWQQKLAVVMGLFLGLWILFTTLYAFNLKRQKQGIMTISLGFLGMIVAHSGIAVSVIGITLVSFYQIEKDVHLKPGDRVSIAHYEVQFVKTDVFEGPNYMSYRGIFNVSNKTNHITQLFPEKRIFLVQKTMMTETAIDAGFFRDIYIALGDKLEKDVWTARIYYKPFVRWIWLGALMVAIGAVCAAISKWRIKRAGKNLK